MVAPREAAEALGQRRRCSGPCRLLLPLFCFNANVAGPGGRARVCFVCQDAFNAWTEVRRRTPQGRLARKRARIRRAPLREHDAWRVLVSRLAVPYGLTTTMHACTREHADLAAKLAREEQARTPEKATPEKATPEKATPEKEDEAAREDTGAELDSWRPVG